MSLPHLKYLFSAAAEGPPVGGVPQYSLQLPGGTGGWLDYAGYSAPASRRVFTISYWARYEGRGASGSGTVVLGAGPSAERLLVYDSTWMEVRQYTGNAQTYFNYWRQSSYLTDDSWHHYCWNWNDRANNYFELWFDGELMTTEGGASASVDQRWSDNLIHYIGRYSSGLGINGNIYDFIYVDNQALTATDFGEGTPGGPWYPKAHNITTGGPATTYLRFELDTGGGLGNDLGADSSGNANHYSEQGTVTRSIDIPATA